MMFLMITDRIFVVLGAETHKNQNILLIPLWLKPLT